VRDVDLAERLGFERPRKVRELIEANLQEINAFGCAPRRGAHIEIEGPNGGFRKQEVQEYWLNEPQALYIAQVSDAPRADDVRVMLIRAFMASRCGRLTLRSDFEGEPNVRLFARNHRRRRPNRPKTRLHRHARTTRVGADANAT
jgi:ribosomal protein S18 acetylase RimI-like enzyme